MFLFGHSITMHNCNCIFINAPLVVFTFVKQCVIKNWIESFLSELISLWLTVETI